MKLMNKIISIAFVFLLGIALGWYLKGGHLKALFTIYLPALATLMATYFGAKYAFDLQAEKEKEVIKQKNIANGNLAIFNLTRMINKLLAYQRQIIDPVRDKATSFLEMRPTVHSEKDYISLNIDPLSFLIETDDPNILGELSVEESKYQSALDAINERSMIHRNEVQPLLERSGVVEGGDYSFEMIEAAIGNRLYTTLKRSTEQVIDHVDTTVESVWKISNKLSQVLRQKYPKEKIINIENPVKKGPKKGSPNHALNSDG
jgi:hypothetical protein